MYTLNFQIMVLTIPLMHLVLSGVRDNAQKVATDGSQQLEIGLGQSMYENVVRLDPRSD